MRCNVYPTPYKMQEIVDKEIDDLLEMGVIERSEAPLRFTIGACEETR